MAVIICVRVCARVWQGFSYATASVATFYVYITSKIICFTEFFMFLSLNSHKRFNWFEKTEKPMKCLHTTKSFCFTITCHILKICFKIIQHLFELAVAQTSSPDAVYYRHSQVHSISPSSVFSGERCSGTQFNRWDNPQSGL